MDWVLSLIFSPLPTLIAPHSLSVFSHYLIDYTSSHATTQHSLFLFASHKGTIALLLILGRNIVAGYVIISAIIVAIFILLVFILRNAILSAPQHSVTLINNHSLLTSPSENENESERVPTTLSEMNDTDILIQDSESL